MDPNEVSATVYKIKSVNDIFKIPIYVIFSWAGTYLLYALLRYFSIWICTNYQTSIFFISLLFAVISSLLALGFTLKKSTFIKQIIGFIVFVIIIWGVNFIFNNTLYNTVISRFSPDSPFSINQLDVQECRKISLHYLFREWRLPFSSKGLCEERYDELVKVIKAKDQQASYSINHSFFTIPLEPGFQSHRTKIVKVDLFFLVEKDTSYHFPITAGMALENSDWEISDTYHDYSRPSCGKLELDNFHQYSNDTITFFKTSDLPGAYCIPNIIVTFEADSFININGYISIDKKKNIIAKRIPYTKREKRYVM